MELKIIEFPNENILPIGYNITIACISNTSDVHHKYEYLPYWLQFYYNYQVKVLHDCGGHDGSVDSQVSKVCELFIQNGTEEDSGNYSCWASTQSFCSYRAIELQFRGKVYSLSILYVKLLLILSVCNSTERVQFCAFFHLQNQKSQFSPWICQMR